MVSTTPLATVIIACMNQALTKQRVRITFGKHGFLRFVGHLDLARTWERMLRRAAFPLEYSQGFNPRPRMQFAAAVPVGVTSDCEYLDVWLTERLDDGFPTAWLEKLAATSPAGLDVSAMVEVPIRGSAVPTLVTSADYVFTPVEPSITPEMLLERARDLLAETTIERTRRDKSYDLRPLILDVGQDEAGDLLVRLMTGDAGNGRPDEFLAALGFDLPQVHIHRCTLQLRDDTA